VASPRYELGHFDAALNCFYRSRKSTRTS